MYKRKRNEKTKRKSYTVQRQKHFQPRHPIFYALHKRVESFLLLVSCDATAVSIRIIIPRRCLCDSPCFISHRDAACFFFYPPVPPLLSPVSLSSDSAATVAPSHQVSRRDYYHTILFVPWKKERERPSGMPFK